MNCNDKISFSIDINMFIVFVKFLPCIKRLLPIALRPVHKNMISYLRGYHTYEESGKKIFRGIYLWACFLYAFFPHHGPLKETKQVDYQWVVSKTLWHKKHFCLTSFEPAIFTSRLAMLLRNMRHQGKNAGIDERFKVSFEKMARASTLCQRLHRTETPS